MAILKCKMCGGDIIAIEGQTYGICDSCGSTVTLPNVNDQRMENLFNRANHFRMVSEFDKAVATYEMILNEDNSNAEAHWGLLLSRYGIEYVEDPTSHERIPTCHRIQNDPILTDDDYLAAVQHAPDGYTRSLYESEGKRLSELQRGLLHVSAQTEPFDIFICYMETTEGGSRTNDSALAQDIYYQLTNAGYKVFFSRVTLESMLGQQYEPHIFAALNSAKVMLAIGTKPEYFNAVWVKNEWSRFLALSRKDRSKVLIPCYRDMNVYDLPDELSMLQSQDMGKIGFIQDLLRGIRKVTQKDEPKPAAQIITQQVVTAGNATVESLMKRAKLFMEDKDFASANEYLDKVLDIDPEYAPAYLGKVQVEMQFQKETQFSTTLKPFEASNDWKKALRFATPEQSTLYKKYLSDSMTAREAHRQQEIYDQASQMLNDAKTIEALSDCYEAQKMFRSITGFKDTETRITACEQKAQAIQQCEYEETLNLYESAKTPEDFEIVVARFSRLGEYKDSAAKAVKAENKKRTLEKKKLKRNLTITSIIATVAIFVIVFITVVKPAMDYNSAKSELAVGNYDAAYSAFVALDDYKDAQAMAQESMYQKGTALLAVGEYDNARVAFESVFGYSDAAAMAQESMYQKGTALLAAGEYDNAKVSFESVSGYSDATTMVQECIYQKGTALLMAREFNEAYKVFLSIRGYQDVDILLENDENLTATPYAMFSVGNYVTFGNYPQTRSGNDDTPIEWLVLKRDGYKALLISRYGLDRQQYNEIAGDGVYWENCALRGWLNYYFLNEAFSTFEQSAILTTTVTSDMHPKYRTSSGPDTQDKIFLLSYNEANSLFGSDAARICTPTDYVKGIRTDGWWLRTPGNKRKFVIHVGNDGNFWTSSTGGNLDSTSILVRPALWVDLDSEVFFSGIK